MSPRNYERTGNSSPAPDVYVGLLFVSLAALVAGITFLVLELNAYDWKLAP